MSLRVGQRVAFIGTYCGIHVGLTRGATGVIAENDIHNLWFVDWYGNEVASQESWCGSCLQPLDDPKTLTIDELAKDIGWQLPAKETA
jgi:hypothetical protein